MLKNDTHVPGCREVDADGRRQAMHATKPCAHQGSPSSSSRPAEERPNPGVGISSKRKWSTSPDGDALERRVSLGTSARVKVVGCAAPSGEQRTAASPAAGTCHRLHGAGGGDTGPS